MSKFRSDSNWSRLGCTQREVVETWLPGEELRHEAGLAGPGNDP